MKVVWPTNSSNPAFDCLILLKKVAIFSKITARDAVDVKLEKTLKNYGLYKKFIDFLKGSGYNVEYIFIYGNGELDKTNKEAIIA